MAASTMSQRCSDMAGSATSCWTRAEYSDGTGVAPEVTPSAGRSVVLTWPEHTRVAESKSYEDTVGSWCLHLWGYHVPVAA